MLEGGGAAMALRVCPECTEAVSERAISCPHCGFPTAGAPPFAGRSIVVAAVGAAALLIGGAGGWALRSPSAAPPSPPAVAAAEPASDCDCDCDAVSDEHDEATPDDNATPAASTLIEQAQDVYVQGKYAAAIRLAKQAVPAEPARAWRVIGAASCFLKDRSGAHEAWSKLNPQGRSFLEYVCSRNKVALP